MSTEYHAVKLVKRIDIILKTLLGFGFLLIAYLIFRHPGLIGVFVLLGVILVGGFYLPRHIGWEIREKRALGAKTQELEKWGFASRDREGPWINYIDYPVVLKTARVAGQQFYSNWLVIDQGHIIVNPGPSIIDKKTNTVCYNLQAPTTYAWDGCTPKRLFYWFALVGTPDWWHREHPISIFNTDGVVTQKIVFWQLAQHASLIHDALYQYLDIIPLSKEEVDDLFYQMLLQSELPDFIAKFYLFAVTKFGANDLPTTRPTYPDLSCESFKHLADN